MRGNHRIIGRDDYVRPPALTLDQLQRVLTITVVPKDGLKTWHEARSGGAIVGYVTTRLGGQSYRLPNQENWCFAANDWCDGEPPHARAILALLTEIDCNRSENCHLSFAASRKILTSVA